MTAKRYAPPPKPVKIIDPRYTSQSERLKRLWLDPEFRARMSALSSERLRLKWEDPAFRARQTSLAGKKLARLWENPDFRADNIDLAKERWDDPEYKAKMAASGGSNPNANAAIKARWNDPVSRAALIAAQHSPEANAKRQATRAANRRAKQCKA